MKNIRIRALLCGKPCLIIKNGKILQNAMRRCMMSPDELTEELRSLNISDISKIQYAVLETDGTLNTVLYPGEKPPTAIQLGIEVTSDGYPYIIIEQGRILGQNLKSSGHDRNWLNSQLESRGVKCADDVYLMIVYDSGAVYFAEKDGKK